MWSGNGVISLPRGLGERMILLVDLALLLVPRVGGSGLGRCPRVCFCNTLSQIVYCSRRGLFTIPQGIPDGTEQLNMNGNFFRNSVLQRSNFTSLTALQHLYLSECGIETIEENTFSDLENLLWLDLSSNRIKLVPDFTFRGLTLRHLFLNGNRNIQLRSQSFEGLVTTGLYLHDCGITTLLPEVLSPLNTTLRYLWLNGNGMERFDKKFLSLFASMAHVRLGNNPLHCNCEFRWLKEFYDQNPEIFKGTVAPNCLTPAPMKGKSFDKLSVADFQCQGPSFNSIDAFFRDNHGRLKCSATGDPAPFIYWIQPSGHTIKYDPPASEDARKTVGQLLLNSDPMSDQQSLRGMYICVANNGAGNVTMTINVTWPSQPVTYDSVTYRTLGETGPAITTTVPLLPNDAPRPVVTKPESRPSTPAREDRPLHSDKPGIKGGHNANPSTSREARTKTSMDETKYTALNNEVADEVPNTRSTSEQRVFNLIELIGAVIGTFVCTLILCFIILPLYLKRRWRRNERDQHHLSVTYGYAKHSPENIYVPRSNHVHDYIDIPISLKR